MPSVTLFFTGILIVWAGTYALGLQNKVTKPSGIRRIPLWTKLIMMVAVLLVGAVGVLRGPVLFSVLVMLGLLIGAVGDLILADVFPLEKPEIPGMIAFAVGHGFYMAAPLTLGMWSTGVLLAAIGAGLVIGPLLWRGLVYNSQGSRRLNTGSFIYGWVLSITLTLATASAFVWPSRVTGMFAAGVVVFTASDLLLAQYMIRKSGPPALRDAVWGLYSTGQMLIAGALWLV